MILKFTMFEKFESDKTYNGSTILELSGVLDSFGEFDYYIFIIPKYISKENDPKMHSRMTRLEPLPYDILDNIIAARRASAFMNVFVNSLNKTSKLALIAERIKGELKYSRFVIGINIQNRKHELFMFKHSITKRQSYLTDDDALKLPIKNEVNPRLFLLTELNYFTNSFPYCRCILYKDGTINDTHSQEIMMNFLESFDEK